MGSHKDITTDQKTQNFHFLLQHNGNGKMKYGMVKKASEMFGVPRGSIHLIRAAGKKQMNSNMQVNFKSNKQGKTSLKKMVIDYEKIEKISFVKRSTIRRLAKEMEISKSVVGRWVKDGVLRPHTNARKPQLTAHNKLQRMNFSLHALTIDKYLNKIVFDEMHNVVHIDEKWFYMSRASERYYLVPGEQEPHRTCKSKNFISKIMFMRAVSRPIFSRDGQVLFDGKIGIFHFTELNQRREIQRIE